MTDRRGFLIQALRGGSVLLVLPAGWTLAGCGGSSTTASTPTPVAPANGLRFTSDTTGGHTHDFIISMDDLAQPPADGVSGDTTVTLNHSHVVALTHDDLAAIQAGQAVSKPTSVVDGHMHTFKFVLKNATMAEATPNVGGATGGAG